MSIRLCRTTRSLRDVDLPILPFLAPRLFGLCPELTTPARHAASFTSRAWRTPERTNRRRRLGNTTALQHVQIAQHAPTFSRPVNNASAQHRSRDTHGTLNPCFHEVDARAGSTFKPPSSSSHSAYRPQKRKSRRLPIVRDGPTCYGTPLTSAPLSLYELEQSFDRLYENYQKLKSLLSYGHVPKNRESPEDISQMPEYKEYGHAPGNATNLRLGQETGDLQEIDEANVKKQDELEVHNEYRRHVENGSRIRLGFPGRENTRIEYISWSAIYEKLYLAKKRDRLQEVDLGLAEDASMWVAELYQNDIGASSVREKWKCVPDKTKYELWPHIVLWSLANVPHAVPTILEATYKESTYQSEVSTLTKLADCLYYLDEFHETEGFLGRHRAAGHHSLAFSIFETNRPQAWVSHHPRLWNVLMKYCTDGETQTVFDGIIERKEKVDMNSMLYLMGRFTEAGNFDFAVKVLEHLAAQGADLSSERILSRCTTLLRRSSSTSGLAVLSRVLKLGIEPNRILNNVILSNAFLTEGSVVGWNVFNHLLAHGFKPNEVTYLTLAQDAMNRADGDLLQSLCVRVSEDEALQKSEMLLSFHMHAFRQIDKNEHPYERHDLLPILFPMFARVHNIQPLKDLGIIPGDWDAPEGITSTTDPTPHALSIMIAAHLHSQPDPGVVLALYSRFRDLVITRRPSILCLTRTAHTYGFFMMALYRHVAYLPHCIQILEDMLAPLPPGPTAIGSSQIAEHEHPAKPMSCDLNRKRPSAPESPQSSHPHTAEPHCKPSIYTWNMLLLAFMVHDQPSSVEKVRNMMFKRGIRFNQVCWNVWIRGIAGMNMTEKVVNALDEMEKEGFWFGFDDWKRQKGNKGMQNLNRILQHWLTMKEERMRTLEWKEELSCDQTEGAVEVEIVTDQKPENVQEQTESVPEGHEIRSLKPLLENNKPQENGDVVSSHWRPFEIKRVTVRSSLEGWQDAMDTSTDQASTGETSTKEFDNGKEQEQNVPQVRQGTSFSPNITEDKIHEDSRSASLVKVMGDSSFDLARDTMQAAVGKGQIKDQPVKIQRVKTEPSKSFRRMPLSTIQIETDPVGQVVERRMKNQGPSPAPPEEPTIDSHTADRQPLGSKEARLKAPKKKRNVARPKNRATPSSKNRKAGAPHSEPKKSLPKLTEEDKARYREEGRCLRCRNLGHGEFDPACPLNSAIPPGVTYLVPQRYLNLPKLSNEDILRFYDEGRCVRCRELGHHALDPKCPLHQLARSNIGGRLVRFSLSEGRAGRDIL